MFPDNIEYPIYALFCDIATEDEERDNHCLITFPLLKKRIWMKPSIMWRTVVDAYDGDIDKMMDLLKEISQSSVDTLDAIKYEDFQKLVESRGSFRVAFEDIMFSTKVAIESKDDFFDFVLKLIENDFNSTAYSYLEGFNEYFSYDEKVEELYKLLEEKKLAHNHK